MTIVERPGAKVLLLALASGAASAVLHPGRYLK